jgi:hypothetical protein
VKDEDLFSHDEQAPTASDPERGGDSDRRALSSAHPVPQDAPSPVHPPLMERRLTARHPLRLLLVAMMVVVLVVLAGGYGVFRALSPTPRQASSVLFASMTTVHTARLSERRCLRSRLSKREMRYTTSRSYRHHIKDNMTGGRIDDCTRVERLDVA